MTQIINPFLNSRITANHDKVDRLLANGDLLIKGIDYLLCDLFSLTLDQSQIVYSAQNFNASCVKPTLYNILSYILFNVFDKRKKKYKVEKKFFNIRFIFTHLFSGGESQAYKKKSVFSFSCYVFWRQQRNLIIVPQIIEQLTFIIC